MSDNTSDTVHDISSAQILNIDTTINDESCIASGDIPKATNLVNVNDNVNDIDAVHIQRCIDENQRLLDLCYHCEEHPHPSPPLSSSPSPSSKSPSEPQVIRLQLDIESLIRKLAFYIVLFASFAFVIYEIIQLYVDTMPFECTIGILLCFAFVTNFDIHRIHNGFSSPLSLLPTFLFPLYKF